MKTFLLSRGFSTSSWDDRDWAHERALEREKKELLVKKNEAMILLREAALAIPEHTELRIRLERFMEEAT